MRLPSSAQRAIDWRVHELAADFELWDVWRLPVDADEALGESFEAVTAWFTSSGLGGTHRGASGLLLRFRMWLGRRFGWDDHVNTLPIPGCEETTLRARLAAGPTEPPAQFEAAAGLAFQQVYQSERESLWEVSNDTCHALLHVGRVDEEGTRWFPQMAVYVKPRGRGGRFYLALIAPFRHLIVYPSMMRTLRARWRRRSEGAVPNRAMLQRA